MDWSSEHDEFYYFIGKHVMENRTKHLIIGAGEVGVGLYHHFLKRDIAVALRDITDTEESTADVLHICFPWSENFLASVTSYIQRYGPTLVVIYTTLPVGTTKQLPPEICVHSPVEGRHPNLTDAFGTFCRIVGFNSSEAHRAVLKHFPALFDCLSMVYNTDKTELMKLLSTGYRYPAMIALAQEQERLCKQHGFDYAEIVTEYDTVYNQGYKALGHENYIRPLLTPGWIGGHCVLHNLELLDRPKDPVVQWIKQSNKKKAQDYS